MAEGTNESMAVELADGDVYLNSRNSPWSLLPPGELAAGPAELLAWASTHWQIENVPLQPTIANAVR